MVSVPSSIKDVQGYPTTSETMPSTETLKLPPVPDQKSLSATSGIAAEPESQAAMDITEAGDGLTIDEGGGVF